MLRGPFSTSKLIRRFLLASEWLILLRIRPFADPSQIIIEPPLLEKKNNYIYIFIYYQIKIKRKSEEEEEEEKMILKRIYYYWYWKL